MAGLFDVLALLVTISIFGGLIYGAMYIMKQITSSVESTKEGLKAKGLDVSASGVSMKTSKRFDHQDYIDATQRGIVKAVGASSFRRGDSSVSTPVLRTDSGSSVHSEQSGDGKKKKSKSLFARS